MVLCYAVNVFFRGPFEHRAFLDLHSHFFLTVKITGDAYHLPLLLDYSCYLSPWGDAERPQT